MIEGLTDPDRGFNRSWKSHHWFYWTIWRSSFL